MRFVQQKIYNGIDTGLYVEVTHRFNDNLNLMFDIQVFSSQTEKNLEVIGTTVDDEVIITPIAITEEGFSSTKSKTFRLELHSSVLREGYLKLRMETSRPMTVIITEYCTLLGRY